MAPSRGKARSRAALTVAAIGAAIWLAAARAAPGPPVVLDDMTAPGRWHAFASDGVAAALEPLAQPEGAALRLRFDFQQHAGFAIAERPLPLDLPDNFELELALGGVAPVNDLELKFVDASGDNVWWYRRPDFAFTPGLHRLTVRRRQIEFAWGPTADRRLRRIERLQIVVSAGRGGGAGTLDIGAIRLIPVAPPPAVWPAPTARAGDAVVPAPDGRPGTIWRCAGGDGNRCELIVDWSVAREFGGARLEWDAAQRAAGYELAASPDGISWQVLRHVTQAVGAVDRLWLPDSEARYIRIRIDGGPRGDAVLRALRLEDPSFGASLNALVASVAREAPRSYYPRGFTEQSYWTLVGVDGGARSGLLSEDGALELDRGGASLEPFIVDEGRLIGWADVVTEQNLADGYLPMPGVRWQSAGWTLDVTAFASDIVPSGLYGRYSVRNRSAQRQHLRLLLALRPLQVNPPSQFLSTPGGVSPIHRLEWDGRTLRVNATTRVTPVVRPDRVGLFPDSNAVVPARLASGEWGSAPQRPAELRDATGLASAVLAYDLDLAPGASATVGVLLPWDEPVASTTPATLGTTAKAARAMRAKWHARLDHLRIAAPDAPEVRDLAAALRTAEAHLLISRTGPILRPGTRSYARSWIRDGAMIAAELLRLGETRAPAEYLHWYSGYLFADGKVPCCIDQRGADPVAEHDSAGEFIYLAAEVYRVGREHELVALLWPQIRAAAAYLERLRQSSRGPLGPTGESARFYGLLPPSISHEGYSAKPMHSYWDDFWALRGYTDAAYLARAFGRDGEAAELETERAQFADDVSASLARVARESNLDFIPGAADLGDFDATSTTILLAPGIGPLVLPPGLLEHTFDRYWLEFLARRDGTRQWQDYTPYEWRTVGSFVRLGARDRAHAALQYFMADRRPPAWNQWPEVIGRERRTPRFIGDLPHGWVASDFIRATLDLFVYERDADQSVVLGAGIAPAWLEGRGVAVSGLRTRYGAVAYTERHLGRALEFRLPAGITVPPGGFILPVPAGTAKVQALVNGRPVPLRDGELTLRAVPARIVIRDI